MAALCVEISEDKGDPRFSLGLEGCLRRSWRDRGRRGKLSRFDASGVGEAVAIVATIACQSHQELSQRVDVYIRDSIGRVGVSSPLAGNVGEIEAALLGACDFFDWGGNNPEPAPRINFLCHPTFCTSIWTLTNWHTLDAQHVSCDLDSGPRRC